MSPGEAEAVVPPNFDTYPDTDLGDTIRDFAHSPKPDCFSLDDLTIATEREALDTTTQDAHLKS